MHLNFLAGSKMFAARLSKKCVWRLRSVTSVCSFWETGFKQHIKLVNSIIVYTSFFITGGLTNAKKRRFKLYLMNTEDQLFQHNGFKLRANILSTPDALPACSIQNTRINIDSTMIVVINNSREAFLGPWIKIFLKCPNVSARCPLVLHADSSTMV